MIYMAETRKQGREMLGARVPRLLKLRIGTQTDLKRSNKSRPVTPALHNLD